jgi:hypothetical protein
MTRPGRYPSPRQVASRVLAIVEAQLKPKFVAALTRRTSAHYTLNTTDEETAAVAEKLPRAVAGRAPEDLDLVVAEIVADQRSRTAADREHQGILAQFGARARPGTVAAGATPGPATAGGTPQQTRPTAPPAVSLSRGTPSGVDTGRASWRSGRCSDPCATAGVDLDIPEVGDVDELSNDEDVTAAAVLAVVYQYGDRIGFFRAIDRAVQQLDSDQLCVEDHDLLNALSCWAEIDYRVTAPERARLVAKILGLSDPHLPEGIVPDPGIQVLLNDLLDAINANCDPGVFRDEPTSFDRSALHRASQAVRARISSSMTTFSILKIKQLQVQFERAQRILAGLAPHVRGRCRAPQYTDAVAAPEWIAVSALLGDRLPDGTELVSAATTANAWRVVFERLADDRVVGNVGEDDEICQAAALLRPTRVSCSGSRDRGKIDNAGACR